MEPLAVGTRGSLRVGRLGGLVVPPIRVRGLGGRSLDRHSVLDGCSVDDDGPALRFRLSPTHPGDRFPVTNQHGQPRTRSGTRARQRTPAIPSIIRRSWGAACASGAEAAAGDSTA